MRKPAAPPAPPEASGPMWTEYRDEGSGKTYFVDEAGNSTWDRPAVGRIVRSASVEEALGVTAGISAPMRSEHV